MTLEEAITTATTLRPRTRALYLAAVEAYQAFRDREPVPGTPEEAIAAKRLAEGAAPPVGVIDTTGSVEAWLAALHQQGLAPQTINLQLRGVRFAAKRRARSDKTPDFTKHVPGVPAVAPTPRPPLTLAQTRQLVRATVGARPIDLRDRALLVLGFRTGMRRTAMCALKLHDLNLVERQLRVPLKAGAQETLILDDETLAALKPWVAWIKQQRPLAHVVAGKACPCGGPLFRALTRTRVNGAVKVRGPMTEHGVYFVLTDRAVKAKLTRVNAKGERTGGIAMYPHLFRCTRATWNGTVPRLVA